jgi:hypothetical protein
MSSREAILSAIRGAQPAATSLPDVAALGVGGHMDRSLAHFIAMLDFIGARVVRAPRLEDALTWLRENLGRWI